MHFKRNLWLSIAGASIMMVAVLFGSKNSEANATIQHNLPQMKQLKLQNESEQTKG
jgi:hypothetical protein